jgi:hypothetical protein
MRKNNMLGKKINEFNESEGGVEIFNSMFPKTPLNMDGYVEILEITDTGNPYTQNLFVRNISINGEIVVHDFGRDNFSDSNLPMEEKIRFKYFAHGLNGEILATAFNIKDLASRLNCGVAVVKNRLVNPINSSSLSDNLFNVTRIEL